jgi:hypothetical protein
LPMSAKFYYFPRSPEHRAWLASMPARKRKKLLHLGNLYWRLLNARLRRILARREKLKREIDL